MIMSAKRVSRVIAGMANLGDCLGWGIRPLRK